MTLSSFRKYYSQIDAIKLKKRYDELITKKECRADKGRFLQEILQESGTSNQTRKQIISIFPFIPHQLCKFHKLKNLNKYIYRSVYDRKRRSNMLRLAQNISRNTNYFGRKRAAYRLLEIAPNQVAAYVKTHILADWKNLTKGYTSNASERWNRKIEKVISGRYGLKSEKFVEQLVTSLWLKEAIRDRRHLGKSFVDELNIKSVYQENL
jgi:hypothetical protein